MEWVSLAIENDVCRLIAIENQLQRPWSFTQIVSSNDNQLCQQLYAFRRVFLPTVSIYRR